MKYLLSILLVGSVLVPLQAKAGDAPLPAQPAAFDTVNYSGIYVRGDIGASFLSSGNSFPSSYVGDAGIGYAFDQNYRADITYNFTGNYALSPAGNLSTNMVLGNFYYDFRNQSPITPYVGVGAGYGWENGSNGVPNAQGVAVGFAAGVAFDMTRNLALDVGYRFHDILANNQNTPEHQIAAGLRVKF